MSKPHEETWRVVAGSSGVRLFTVVSDTYRDGASQVVCRNLDEREAKLIAVAPDLAQALVVCGEVIDGVWHMGACINANNPYGKCTQSCIKARGALTKAGVL